MKKVFLRGLILSPVVYTFGFLIGLVFNLIKSWVATE